MSTQRRIRASLRLATFAAIAAWGAAGPTTACVEGDMRGDVVTLVREVAAPAAGADASLNVVGAGWFRAAEIVKQGGNSDNTNVTLELDGQPLISTSFAALKNAWMQLDTPFIVAKVTTQGDTSTMTIWYQPEPRFLAIAVLHVDVQEEGVQSVRLRATMNKPYPHAHLPGQTPTTLAAPAFK